VISVVGLSHRTAPIQVREKLALPADELPDLLRNLVQEAQVGEALIVSTCNRVELVAAPRAAGEPDLERVAEICARALAARAPAVAPYLYRYSGGAAVRHLFRVAASLDSLVLGEPQILGQVKDAYELARHAGTIGSILHRTLPRALRAAKRVRTETSIGSGQVSVPSVALDLTRQIFGELGRRSVLLVGSGEMAETVAKLLRGAGAKIVVVGRTRERVDELARGVGGQGRTWSELRATLCEADVVITSTSAPGFVIERDMVSHARRSRRGESQFYVDLAVPRDVDPRVESIEGVFLYNVDDLSRVVEGTLSSRSREAERAEAIVQSEAQGYDRWADAEQATPTIVALRARLRAALEAELSRSLRGRLKHLGGEERAALSVMLEASLNRVLHGPTVRLRQVAVERQNEGLSFEELRAALDELFALSGEFDDSSFDAPDSEPVGASQPVSQKTTGVAPEGDDCAWASPARGASPGGAKRVASGGLGGGEPPTEDSGGGGRAGH
jgi:glutamyl-tRNA reductase